VRQKIADYVQVQRDNFQLAGVTKREFLDDFSPNEKSKLALKSFGC